MGGRGAGSRRTNTVGTPTHYTTKDVDGKKYSELPRFTQEELEQHLNEMFGEVETWMSGVAGYLNDEFGAPYVLNLAQALNDADPLVKSMWKAAYEKGALQQIGVADVIAYESMPKGLNGDELIRWMDSHHVGAHYSYSVVGAFLYGSVTIQLSADGLNKRNVFWDRDVYDTFFHEFGHAIDHTLAYTTENSPYATLSELMTRSYAQDVDKLKRRFKAAATRNGVTVEEQIVNSFARRYTSYIRDDERLSDLSDMLEGAGVGEALFDYGHGGDSYWGAQGTFYRQKRTDTEFFAEMTSMLALHRNTGLTAVKDALPATYKNYFEKLYDCGILTYEEYKKYTENNWR